MEQMLWVWLGVFVLACFFEFATAAQLVSIWAAVGAVAAMIASFCNASVEVQFIIFFAVSILSLILTRPLVKKLIHNKNVPTNADMCIGQKGKVLAEIHGDEIRGQVRVSGTVWTAISEADGIIPEGAEVLVKRIEGVKLVVEPV